MPDLEPQMADLSEAVVTMSYGVVVDISMVLEQWPAPHTGADVLIIYNGERKAFTYQEFLKILGFSETIPGREHPTPAPRP